MKRIIRKSVRSAKGGAKGGVNVASDVNIVVARGSGGGAAASSRTAGKISQSTSRGRFAADRESQADTERKEKE